MFLDVAQGDRRLKGLSGVRSFCVTPGPLHPLSVGVACCFPPLLWRSKWGLWTTINAHSRWPTSAKADTLDSEEWTSPQEHVRCSLSPHIKIDPSKLNERSDHERVDCNLNLCSDPSPLQRRMASRNKVPCASELQALKFSERNSASSGYPSIQTLYDVFHVWSSWVHNSPSPKMENLVAD